MKIGSKYLEFKVNYPESIILIKVGNFYDTFGDDAAFLNYYLGYQIVGERVGFPLNALEKVTNTLYREDLDVIIVNSDNYIIKKAKTNAYKNKLDDVKNKAIFQEKIDKLLKTIELKVKINKDNLDLIKEFVDRI